MYAAGANIGRMTSSNDHIHQSNPDWSLQLHQAHETCFSASDQRSSICRDVTKYMNPISTCLINLPPSSCLDQLTLEALLVGASKRVDATLAMLSPFRRYLNGTSWLRRRIYNELFMPLFIFVSDYHTRLIFIVGTTAVLVGSPWTPLQLWAVLCHYIDNSAETSLHSSLPPRHKLKQQASADKRLDDIAPRCPVNSLYQPPFKFTALGSFSVTLTSI